MEQLFQPLINGLMAGFIYVLVALGLTLVFSIMGIINFAHGEIYMLGAFVTYILTVSYRVNFFLSMVIAMGVMILLGLLIERIIFRPLRGHQLNILVISLGLAILLQNLALIAWGPDDVSIPSPYPEAIEVLGINLSMERLAAVVIAAILITGLHLFLQFSRSGRAMRAVSQDPEAASLQGVPIERIESLSFGLGCALAAAAGGLIGPIFVISPFIGTVPVMKAFVVIILGGLGSIPGAVLGGIILGVTESFSATFVGAIFQDMIGFFIILLVLILKPSGLLGYE